MHVRTTRARSAREATGVQVLCAQSGGAMRKRRRGSSHGELLCLPADIGPEAGAGAGMVARTQGSMAGREGGMAGGEVVGAGGEVVGAGGEVVGAGGEVVGAGGEVVGAGGEVVGAGGEVVGAGGEVVGAGGEVVGAGGEVVGAGGEVVGAGGEVVGAGGEVVGAGGEVVGAELPSHHMKPRNGPLIPLSQPGQPGQRMRDREVDCQYRTEGQGQDLHRCAMGYAGWANVTGGKGKVVYWVSSSMDHPTRPLPGSLRWALFKHRGGAIIRFSRSMVVNLTERLFVRSDTTIDGRGATVKINGPMAVYGATNVIIHNLAIGNAKGNTDALHIRKSSRVWVDHCRVTNAYRGTIDVVKGSTNVTISNCFIRNFGFTMLLGAADADTIDKQMRVTVYRNWFFGSGQRQPHGRWGQIHVANNLYTNWTYYCLGGRVHANIRSDRNIFVAGKGRKEVTPWFGPQSPSVPGFDNTPTIRSFNDSLRNGATFHVFPGTPPKPTFVPPYKLPLHSADDILGAFVARNAGPRVGTAPLLPCTANTCWSCC
ncbi:unnamed protein product [Closterium sp. NIES-65]|nr:unnamed protein product [Closterium sp. NIES-65]